jgi:hypothetical protein
MPTCKKKCSDPSTCEGDCNEKTTKPPVKKIPTISVNRNLRRSTSPTTLPKTNLSNSSRSPKKSEREFFRQTPTTPQKSARNPFRGSPTTPPKTNLSNSSRSPKKSERELSRQTPTTPQKSARNPFRGSPTTPPKPVKKVLSESTRSTHKTGKKKSMKSTVRNFLNESKKESKGEDLIPEGNQKETKILLGDSYDETMILFKKLENDIFGRDISFFAKFIKTKGDSKISPLLLNSFLPKLTKGYTLLHQNDGNIKNITFDAKNPTIEDVEMLLGLAQNFEVNRLAKLKEVHEVLIYLKFEIEKLQRSMDTFIFNSPNSFTPIMDPSELLYIKNQQNETLIFKKKSVKGEGSYGTVFEYYNSMGLKYAVKIPLNKNDRVLNEDESDEDESDEDESDEDTEKKVISMLNELKIIKKTCDISPARIIATQATPCVLMPLFDGDLEKLDLTEFSQVMKKNMLDDIRNQLESIIKLNNTENIESDQSSLIFGYIDLKPPNVLYSKLEDGSYIFKLADLGSIIRNKHGSFDTTYPIFFTCSTDFFEISDSRSPFSHIVRCMRYVFGILAHVVMTNSNNVQDNIFERDRIVNDLGLLSSEIVAFYGQDYENLLYDESEENKTSMFD